MKRAALNTRVREDLVEWVKAEADRRVVGVGLLVEIALEDLQARLVDVPTRKGPEPAQDVEEPPRDPRDPPRHPPVWEIGQEPST